MIPASKEALQRMNAMGATARGEAPPKKDPHIVALQLISAQLAKISAAAKDEQIVDALGRIADMQEKLIESMQKQAERRREFTFEVTSRSPEGYAKTVKVVEK